MSHAYCVALFSINLQSLRPSGKADVRTSHFSLRATDSLDVLSQCELVLKSNVLFTTYFIIPSVPVLPKIQVSLLPPAFL